MKYRTIYADPPWSEFGGGQIKRGADRHYGLMPTGDICRLQIQPPECAVTMAVGQFAMNDSHLYLWVTNNKLLDGLEVVKAWGFEYKTLITWAKDKFGLGQYYRGQTEHVIFATRGVCPYRVGENGKRAQGRTLIDGGASHGARELLWELTDWAYGNGFRPQSEDSILKRAYDFVNTSPQGFDAPRGKHSAKPTIMRKWIEEVSPGPYLELFARERVEGWDCWGDEVECSNQN